MEQIILDADNKMQILKRSRLYVCKSTLQVVRVRLVATLTPPRRHFLL